MKRFAGNQDDANSETTEASDYSTQLQQMLSPASSGTLGGGLPPAATSSGRVATSLSGSEGVAPSPNQVRRSKRQPMADLSGGSSCNGTPSPVPLPLSSVGIAHRGVVDYRQQHGAHDLQPSNPQQLQQSVSVGNSPTHVLRSPRMGRKSLRPYQQQQQQQQQPAPPLYENQIYPPIENLSLDDSPRYRSEPMIYSSRLGPEQQVEPSPPPLPASLPSESIEKTRQVLID